MAKTNTNARDKKTKTAKGAATPSRPVVKSRNAGAPRARRYRYSETSTPTSRAPSDDRTIKRTAQIELVRPAWNGNLPTTFRPFPAFCPENPEEFDPTRLSTDAYDLSDWIRGMPAAKYVGVDNKFTFLLWDPVSERMGEYDPRSNPYVILNRAIRDAVDEGEAILGRHRLNISKWAPLVSDRSKKKAFSSVTKLYYTQGLIYQHRDEIFVKDGQPPKGARENDLPQIIQVSKTGGEDLANLLNETVEGFTGDTSNHAEYYVYGETVDLVDGSFITFYNPEKHNLDTEVIDATDDDIEEEAEVEVAGNSREFKGWKAQVDREFFYVNKRRRRKCKADITKYAKSIGKNLQWWDDVLHIPTHDEICMFLANGFRSIPNLIKYGWADHPEFFTDEVKGLLANRTQGQGAEVPADEGTESSAIPDDELDSFDDDELEGEVVTEEFDESDYEGTDDEDAVEVVEELADGTVVEDEVEEISGDDDDTFEEDVAEVEEEQEQEEEEVAEVVEDPATEKARKAAEARSAARGSGKKPTPKKK